VRCTSFLNVNYGTTNIWVLCTIFNLDFDSIIIWRESYRAAIIFLVVGVHKKKGASHREINIISTWNLTYIWFTDSG
jgi:hypothetical protein